MKNIFIFCILFATIGASSKEKEVVVLGTVHGDHNRFPLYNFETLRIVLEHINPDILLIEEDPKTFDKVESLSEEEYGKLNRPIEIKKVLLPFSKKHKIKLVPTDERAAYDAMEPTIEATLKAKATSKDFKELMAAVYTAYESFFLDDYLTKSFYEMHSDTSMAILEQRLKIMRAIPELKEINQTSDDRQNAINKNVTAALKNEKFTRAVVIYGISHRPDLVRAIKKISSVKLLRPEEAMESKVKRYFDRDKLLTLPF